MGGPPGAPQAIGATPRTNTKNIPRHHVHRGDDLTPRAVLALLPMLSHIHAPLPISILVSNDFAGPSRAAPNPQPCPSALTATAPTHAPNPALNARLPHRHHHHHHYWGKVG